MRKQRNMSRYGRQKDLRAESYDIAILNNWVEMQNQKRRRND
jgi:hypothetical protein